MTAKNKTKTEKGKTTFPAQENADYEEFADIPLGGG
jgi:hypothetical protein